MSRLLNLKRLIDALMNANGKRKRPKMSVAKVNRWGLPTMPTSPLWPNVSKSLRKLWKLRTPITTSWLKGWTRLIWTTTLKEANLISGREMCLRCGETWICRCNSTNSWLMKTKVCGLMWKQCGNTCRWRIVSRICWPNRSERCMKIMSALRLCTRWCSIHHSRRRRLTMRK